MMVRFLGGFYHFGDFQGENPLFGFGDFEGEIRENKNPLFTLGENKNPPFTLGENENPFSSLGENKNPLNYFRGFVSFLGDFELFRGFFKGLCIV